jgi:hypothetical protein
MERSVYKIFSYAGCANNNRRMLNGAVTLKRAVVATLDSHLL